MALRALAQFPAISPYPSSSKSGNNRTSSSANLRPPRVPHLNLITKRRQPPLLTALDESRANSDTESTPEEGEPPSAAAAAREPVEVSELGAEIKKAMEERKEKEKGGGGGDFLSGVAEEIGEIEWPVFGKVLGTTGVVLGVIAGSSVVLLTVNAVLAELSDKVFAGKGVQDFFG